MTSATSSGADRMGPLRTFRLQAGLTQDELASAAGVSRETVIRLEQGHTRPNSATLRCLAAALAVEPADLLDPRPSKTAAPQVVRVAVGTLRELRDALHGSERGQIERLTAEVDHLIAAAEESAWPS